MCGYITANDLFRESLNISRNIETIELSALSGFKQIDFASKRFSYPAEYIFLKIHNPFLSALAISDLYCYDIVDGAILDLDVQQFRDAASGPEERLNKKNGAFYIIASISR